jgi:hypothetical protein
MESLKAQKELCAQIITLATTLLAFTVAFVDKFGTHEAAGHLVQPPMLRAAWIAYILAIIFALWAIMAIVGTMTALEAGNDKNPSRSNIYIPAGLMVCTFITAVALTASAGLHLS